MSRWGRGRGGSVAVPLDSALFRENSNCPSAARSAGTVGKWGITSFTSLRSAPYAYANSVKKTVQDQNSPLTVPAVETEQAPPKPKKFFKSRNTEPYPPVPQIIYAPPVPPAPLSPEYPSHSKDKKVNKRSRVYNRDSSSPELPRRNSEKTKSKKSSVATKASKKEETPAENTQPPNKRYLVRNRNKVINYAEDGSNSPIPDFTRYESIYSKVPQIATLPIESAPKVPSPKASPLQVPSPTISPLVLSPSVKPVEKFEVSSPSTSKDLCDERKPPPIVLRISKGTSRIVSTDSNEGFTSPGSDRHSSLDTHSDVGSDHKKSPSMETICSPKHEGLKITIKCAGLTQEPKKDKKKDKKEHKSHKRHRKNSDDEPLKKIISSPIPGTDAYDLYKTLASPSHDNEGRLRSKVPSKDDIESQLAKLDSGSVIKSSRLEIKPNELPPEPKPPETSGRSRRNRPNVNYSENDDYLDAITSGKVANKHTTKTVSDIKKETRKTRKKVDMTPDALSTLPEVDQDVEKTEIPIETRKTRKKHDITTVTDTAPLVTLLDTVQGIEENEAENSNLVDNLSESDSGKKETTKVKLHRKHKHKHHKNLSPKSDTMETMPEEEPIEETTTEEPIAESCASNDEETHDEGTSEVPQDFSNNTPTYAQANTHSSDSAYNSCPNENFEDEVQKNTQEDVFKSPSGMADEDHLPVEEKPSVKLVITKKKGSIFKSKSLVNDNPSPLPARKRRHLYKHQWANEKGNETPRPEPTENSDNQVGAVSQDLTRVTRFRPPDPIIDESETVTRPYTSVRCAKEAKEFYTVVRNVKKAHQIQEIGEFQEFNDDVEYLLDALQNNNPISTRCLSAITLASKCTAPAFRMHLRAHGTVQKFFSALHDATNDQSLGLCTATVMFVLSQDRLNMDVDRESLELMLNLLESDASHKNALDDCGLTSAQLTKTQERVRELCAEIKSQGKAQHLDLENITVGHLAMETLLSLTSKRAGEWFKEELRVLGGVDHIVRTIQDCAARLDTPVESWTATDVEVLRKADRCLRVLENVTQQNEDNQLYLCGGGGHAARTICGVLRAWCGAARHFASLRSQLLDAALPALKVLLNLSHSFSNTTSVGAQVIGEQLAVMETCLIILNNQGNFIPDDRNFEFSVCVLLLLINLVQNNESNTQRLLNIRIRIDNEDEVISRSVGALDLIVDLFYKREELARRAEENTDALLDGKPEDSEKKSQDDIDETVAKLLARAGAHMEHSMVGAYVALLLGHAAHARPAALRARVPLYAPLLPTLKKYYAFLALTASAESAIVAHVKATHRIIEFMEASDAEQNAAYDNPPDDVPQDMSLNNMAHNYSNYSNTSSDRSMELDQYH